LQAYDDTIRDIDAKRDPLDVSEVRRRLGQLTDQTNTFATEDRDEVGRYAVRIWRAAGFKEDSGLLPVGDVRALAHPDRTSRYMGVSEMSVFGSRCADRR
jgi:hypothetical protein